MAMKNMKMTINAKPMAIKPFAVRLRYINGRKRAAKD